VFKVPLLVALYAEALGRRIRLDERVTYRDAFKVAGSGVLQFLHDGLNPTLRDLAVLMMIVSDNTATDMVLERVTKSRVEAAMREYGLDSIAVPFGTRELLMELVDMDPAAPGGYDELRAKLRASHGSGGRAIVPEQSDRSTPRDMCRLIEMVARETILDPASCREILGIMEKIQNGARLPGLLPRGIAVAHKTGSLRRIRNDVGLVRAPNGPYAVAIFSRELKRDNVDDDRALAAISLAVYEDLAG
jgi:beta-lactamase class A